MEGGPGGRKRLLGGPASGQAGWVRVPSLSHVWLWATPWTVARQAIVHRITKELDRTEQLSTAQDPPRS